MMDDKFISHIRGTGEIVPHGDITNHIYESSSWADVSDIVLFPFPLHLPPVGINESS